METLKQSRKRKIWNSPGNIIQIFGKAQYFPVVPNEDFVREQMLDLARLLRLKFVSFGHTPAPPRQGRRRLLTPPWWTKRDLVLGAQLPIANNSLSYRNLNYSGYNLPNKLYRNARTWWMEISITIKKTLLIVEQWRVFWGQLDKRKIVDWSGRLFTYNCSAFLLHGDSKDALRHKSQDFYSVKLQLVQTYWHSFYLLWMECTQTDWVLTESFVGVHVNSASCSQSCVNKALSLQKLKLSVWKYDILYCTSGFCCRLFNKLACQCIQIKNLVGDWRKCWIHANASCLVTDLHPKSFQCTNSDPSCTLTHQVKPFFRAYFMEIRAQALEWLLLQNNRALSHDLPSQNKSLNQRIFQLHRRKKFNNWDLSRNNSIKASFVRIRAKILAD